MRATVGLSAALAVLGCGGRAAPPNTTSSTLTSRSDDCVPAGWVAREMVSSDLGAEDRPPGADVEARVLTWRTKEDERPLHVESAIVWVEVKTPGAQTRWLLLAVFRHPRVADGSAKIWRLAQIADTPVSGVERFETPPTDADVERFLDASGWKDGATGFKELAAGVCRTAWPSGGGR